MAEVMSQSQIDELLNNLSSGDINIKEIESQENKIKEYDFKSPKKVTKETIKLLKSIYENYCRILSSFMTSKLGLMCDITVQGIEESIFFEYSNALDEYTMMGLVDIKYPDGTPSENQMIMEISKSLSFMMMERLLGGDGEEPKKLRDYTDIELRILSNLMKQMVNHMGKAWESTIDISTEMTKYETNPRFISNINYNNTIVMITLEANVNGTIGKINICIPFEIIGDIYKKSNIFKKSNKKKNNSESQKEDIIDTLKVSNLNITGILGKTELTLKDILNIQVGDVISLDREFNSDIDINVDGKLWFKGKFGIKKNRNVVKINKILG